MAAIMRESNGVLPMTLQSAVSGDPLPQVLWCPV